jgi:hypothetical protein
MERSSEEDLLNTEGMPSVGALKNMNSAFSSTFKFHDKPKRFEEPRKTEETVPLILYGAQEILAEVTQSQQTLLLGHAQLPHDNPIHKSELKFNANSAQFRKPFIDQLPSEVLEEVQYSPKDTNLATGATSTVNQYAIPPGWTSHSSFGHRIPLRPPPAGGGGGGGEGGKIYLIMVPEGDYKIHRAQHVAGGSGINGGAAPIKSGQQIEATIINLGGASVGGGSRGYGYGGQGGKGGGGNFNELGFLNQILKW